MASNVGTLLTVLLDESQKPSKTTQLTRSLVRALGHYRGKRTFFTQKNTSFAVTAGTAEYQLPTLGSSTGKIPDFEAMDDIRWSDSAGSRLVKIEKISYSQMRDQQYYPAARANQPRFWTIHHAKLILWPVPATTGDLMQCWYQFDATRNESNGAEIDGATSTDTNEWFRTGLDCLRTFALFDFFQSYVKDSEAALSYGAMNAKYDSDMDALNANYEKPARVARYW